MHLNARERAIQDIKKELIERVREWGADVVGVADTARLEGIGTRPDDLLEGWPRAVVMGVRLSGGVMDTVKDGPTELYSQHYQRVNALLDDVATKLMGWIQERGGQALPMPASQILCEETFHSYLSHKAVALAAGIGWQGKSTLLVTPQFGPRLRLVTVLTDLDLPPDEPMKNRCGKCTICADACPAGAIKGEKTDYHFASRDAALDLDACVSQLNRFSQADHITPYLCGVCVASCPWGKKKKKKKEKTG
jgi:epoxyqueuosine reductase QueG